MSQDLEQSEPLLINEPSALDSRSGSGESVPDPPLPTNLKIAVTASILTTFCNGLSYSAISSSLNLFLQSELEQNKASASINTAVFVGTRFFISISGAVIADSWLGRFKTICIGLLLYFFGLSGVAFVAYIADTPSNDIIHNEIDKQYMFWFSLYLIAFGSGCVGPNNNSLGAEQFESYDLNKKQLTKSKESFFGWRYFGNNCAELISYSVVAYLCQEVSFKLGYTIPAGSILAALFIFVSPYKLYYKFKPKGSVLLKFIKILIALIFKRTQKLENYQADEIKDVKGILRILPFWFCYIIYFSVWSQLNTLIYAQGCQMDYRIRFGSTHWNLPIAALSLFSIIPILILIPIFDKCLFPFCRNRSFGCKCTMFQKIGIGMIFAMLSMIAAAVVEIFRRDYSAINDQYKSVCGKGNIYISNISIFWQIPIFIFDGLSEALTAVTGYEFFFNEAPKNMKSVMSAFFTMSVGLGSWMTGIYVLLANLDKKHEMITNDLNNGHLDFYFGFIAILVFMDLIFFLYQANKYKYKNGYALNDGTEIEEQNCDDDDIGALAQDLSTKYASGSRQSSPNDAQSVLSYHNTDDRYNYSIDQTIGSHNVLE